MEGEFDVCNFKQKIFSGNLMKENGREGVQTNHKR